MNKNDPIHLYCPECHRIQAVDPMTYQTSLSGHPLTCNGGNPDTSTHHDHEVILRPVALKNTKEYSCPRCGYPQYCGCEGCIRFMPLGYEPRKVCDDGEGYICANCGLTMGCDAWNEESTRQHLFRGDKI